MGGRVQLIDLPPLLNVDLKAVEERIYDLVKRSRGKMTLTQEGEIISASYLSLVAQEINETVQQVREALKPLLFLLVC
jgi:NAD-specific glutamate dehydrogenase